MMTDVMAELREALQRRIDVVADRALYESDPAAHLEKLKAASFAVDRLAAQLPPGTDPQLRHFLERQSYLKAIDWLKAREGGQ
jgi:Mg-chelatase subunit ChlI